MDFTAECEALLEAIPLPESVEPAPFTEEDVLCQINRCKLGIRPDDVPARSLKACAHERLPELHSLFCESNWTTTILTLWKNATINPCTPKNRGPLYLTTIALLCLEKLLLRTIMPVFAPPLDPLQFAYKASKGTEDTVACLMRLLLQHLDSPGDLVRILFVDFSSVC